MARSLGFGFNTTDYIIFAHLRLAFASPLGFAHDINSLTHYTKGTSSGIGRPPTACKHPVSGSVSLPCPGSISPFPHGTSSLSVVHEYLDLGGGPPIFKQDYTCPVLLSI